VEKFVAGFLTFKRQIRSRCLKSDVCSGHCDPDLSTLLHRH
jgi:hypothetical protein